MPIPVAVRYKGTYCYTGARNDTTQKTGQTPDKQVYVNQKHFCLLYGEVNSVKNTTINIWLNDGVY